MTTDIGSTFRALHQPGNPFILANAWDIGSAKMLASLGAQAIAASSGAHAFTLGRSDGGHVMSPFGLSEPAPFAASMAIVRTGAIRRRSHCGPQRQRRTARTVFLVPRGMADPRIFADARVKAAGLIW